MKLHIPIKDNEWWNGIPYLHELGNLKSWRCHFTQAFGVNKEIYKQFGMEGHNGIDIGYKEGTPVVAPCDIDVQAAINSDDGYGIHLWAYTKPVDNEKLELVFGHLKEIIIEPFQSYKVGTILGYGDSTGFSTGNHLHFGIRPLYKKGEGWYQKFYGNGYLGYVDPEPYLIEKVRWTIGELEDLKNMKLQLVQKKGDKDVYIMFPITNGYELYKITNATFLRLAIKLNWTVDWDKIWQVNDFSEIEGSYTFSEVEFAAIKE